jgi:hypothetical protein
MKQIITQKQMQEIATESGWEEDGRGFWYNPETDEGKDENISLEDIAPVILFIQNHEECDRCNGSGEIALSIYNLGYVAAGPVPDDSTKYTAATCDYCKGHGIISIKQVRRSIPNIS